MMGVLSSGDSNSADFSARSFISIVCLFVYWFPLLSSFPFLSLFFHWHWFFFFDAFIVIIFPFPINQTFQ
jgi:hypothetical protein